MEILKNTESYRDVRISTEHNPDGTADTRELFVHIPYDNGDIKLTRVSTTKKPKSFVISHAELIRIATQSDECQNWLKRRNQAYDEARKLLKEHGMTSVIWIRAEDDDASFFTIMRYKLFGNSEEFLPSIHMDQLVSATQSAIEMVAAEKVEETRLIEIELQKLKAAGFKITVDGDMGIYVDHKEFDYQAYLHFVVKEVQENTPRLLNKLEEIRKAKAQTAAIFACVQRLRDAGFKLQSEHTQDLLLYHPELIGSFTIKRNLEDAEAKTQQALETLSNARKEQSLKELEEMRGPWLEKKQDLPAVEASLNSNSMNSNNTTLLKGQPYDRMY